MSFLSKIQSLSSSTENTSASKLAAILQDLLKEDKNFDYNKKFSEFKDEALKRANEKGLRVLGIDVMQMLDKILKKNRK